MENFLTQILLFIISGLLAAIGISLRKVFRRHANRIDILGFKASAINYGVEETLGEPYKIKRNEKWENLIEEDELKNKER